MRKIEMANVVVSSLLAICIGCNEGEKSTKITPATEQPTATAKATPEDNPTTRGGRGEPSLEDLFSPAAWIYVDGEEGRFIEKEGNPQLQWVIHTPVGRSPTFRVEAFEPLLGQPTEFQCALQTYESFDGSTVVYAIRSKEGRFQAGKDYSLLKPGDDFVVLNKATDEEVAQIPLLSAGTYGLVAGIRNPEWQAEGLAITYFTVGGEVEEQEAADGTPAPGANASPTEGGGK